MSDHTSALILNKDAQSIAELTTNLLPKGCRIDQLEGRDHTVVPMVILTEGVHAGSGGPVFYPKDELSKTPEVWNQKPVVVYHPTMNGRGISACDQTVINSRKVGVMMNTRFEDGKLKSEAWIDAALADKVDERVMEAVNNSTMMELSTGVFVDVENEPGIYNKESYDGIARNYRPDHLALLPDQIGACSIADGAGFLRNKAGEKLKMVELLEIVGNLTGNVLSHDDIRMVLASLLTNRFTNGIQEFPIWVTNVFPKQVIYEDGGKLYRLAYSVSKDVVELGDGPPEEVKERRSYVPVTNNNEPQNKNMEENQKLIKGIVGNAEWTEDDRKTLEAMSAAQLKRIHDGIHNTAEPTKAELAANAEAIKVEAAKLVEADKAAEAAKLTANAEDPKPIDLKGYIDAAPPQIQEVLNNGVATYNAEKLGVVTEILGNERNTFTEQELNARDLGELKKMQGLMAPAPVENQETERPLNYGGQAPTPVANKGSVEEAMEIPTLNYAK